MPRYVLLTKLTPKAAEQESVNNGAGLHHLNMELKKTAREACPEIEWEYNLATLGPYDYLDIFWVPCADDAMAVSSQLRTTGFVTTEIWPAVSWDEFKNITQAVGAAEASRA